jgi:hypothetical protein
VSNEDHDYEVGYRRPPTKNQFQKGRSGNPSGRPKGSKNIPSMLQKICHAPVKVKAEDGRTKHISKIEAIMTQLANAAARSDPKAARVFFAILKEFRQSWSRLQCSLQCSTYTSSNPTEMDIRHQEQMNGSRRNERIGRRNKSGIKRKAGNNRNSKLLSSELARFGFRRFSPSAGENLRMFDI